MIQSHYRLLSVALLACALVLATPCARADSKDGIV